jgi:hypothetical protein
MPIFPGGDIVPSILAVSPRRGAHEDNNSFNNFFLRMGEVIEIMYPDDKRSRSKKFTEYRVLVQERSNGTGTGRVYENCLLMNPLGGIADFSSQTLRVDKDDDRTKAGLGKGTKVLIQCINGEQNSAVIVGGLRDETDKRDEKSKDLGHHFVWHFNGIAIYIDKDGQLLLEYKGKTDIDGSVNDDVSDDAKGSKAMFLKNGDIKLQTKDAKQLIHLDAENGKVIIQRDKGLEIGEATDEMLLGKSFRDNQKQLHDELKQYLGLAKNMMQQAGTQLNTAGGAVAGPFMAAAAGPSMIAAAQLLIQVSTIFDQMKQAIDDFELAGQDKNSYLSKKNKAD